MVLTSECLATSSLTLVTLCSVSVPGLPGAQNRCLHMGDWESFHARECSRPPEPTTRTLTWCKPKAWHKAARLR